MRFMSNPQLSGTKQMVMGNYIIQKVNTLAFCGTYYGNMIPLALIISCSPGFLQPIPGGGAVGAAGQPDVVQQD